MDRISTRAIQRARFQALRNQTAHLYYWESGLDFRVTICDNGNFEAQEYTHEALRISDVKAFSDKA